jgi:hypothetical protein
LSKKQPQAQSTMDSIICNSSTLCETADAN